MGKYSIPQSEIDYHNECRRVATALGGSLIGSTPGGGFSMKHGRAVVEVEHCTLEAVSTMTAALAAAHAENERLRKLLWLRHGCGIRDLYGDDGEMQCSKCRVDFKRWPADQIDEAFEKIARAALAPANGGEEEQE